MSFLTVLLSIFISLPLSAQSAAEIRSQSAPTPKKNSVEDIFIWKVSDELNLSATEEKKFSDIHRELNKQKMQLATQLQKMSFQSKDNPELSKARASEIIKDYKKTLTAYNNLSLQELDKMKSLLGDKKFLDYLAIKQDINLKLKSLVLGDEPSKTKSTKLPQPQIIEEK